MADVLTTVATAIGLAKSLVGLADEMDKAQLKLTAADLTVQLAELKIKLADLLEENASLKTKLTRATGPAEVIFRDGFYYKGDNDGPFCTACYDSGKKLIRVVDAPEAFQFHFGKRRCPSCDTFYQ